MSLLPQTATEHLSEALESTTEAPLYDSDMSAEHTTCPSTDLRPSEAENMSVPSSCPLRARRRAHSWPFYPVSRHDRDHYRPIFRVVDTDSPGEIQFTRWHCACEHAVDDDDDDESDEESDLSDEEADKSDDIDDCPEKHFLSPIHDYEYDDWSTGSDDECAVEDWDAGICDFTLFEDDRQQAEEGGKPLPGRWNTLVASQASALQRANKRARVLSDLESTSADPHHQVPALTPDNSPDLRDELSDAESEPPTSRKPASTFSQLPRVTLRGPTFDTRIDNDYFLIGPHGMEDDDHLSARAVHRALEESEPLKRRPWIHRPGLTFNRTLSGKPHSWDVPSEHITIVEEEPEEEKRAEREYLAASWAGEEGSRGRNVARPAIQRCSTSRV